MTDAPVKLVWITTALQNADWSDIYVPINSPNAYGVEYDARDALIPKNNLDTWQQAQSFRDSIVPELFEGFEGWTRKYTDDNTSLTVEIYFKNADLAMAYNKKVIEVQEKLGTFELKPKVDKFQFYWAIRNRKTGELYYKNQ